MSPTTLSTRDPAPPADPALTSKFRLEELIGTGGHAHVWRGVQIGLGRPVAIKILRTPVVDRVFARHAKRFEREAQLLSRLHDPHTITLHDFGTLQGGAMFMVFEFVDGVNLSDLLTTCGRLAPGRVAKIMRQLLSSLQEAHSIGVLHRDLKPSNIMLYERSGRRDLVKLLDFGIAKILGQDINPITAKGQVLGTPRYIPPEAVGDHPYTASSDLYSLGLVAYELLVGAPAIEGHTTREIIARVLDPSPIELPDSLDVPPALRSIITRMLLRDPSLRYQTAGHVLADLQRWHEHSPLLTDPDGTSSLEHDPAPLPTGTSSPRLTAPLAPVEDGASPAEIPTSLVDALQPQGLATTKLNALDLSRDSGPTLPLAPIRASTKPLREAPDPDPAESIDSAGRTRPMFKPSTSPAPTPTADPTPAPIDAADAHDLLFSDPGDAPAGDAPASADETPSRSPSAISGESVTLGGSTERFPNMLHRTVGAPKVDPSLRVDRAPKQRPAITPSKLERIEPEPTPRKPRLDTVQVDHIPLSASTSAPEAGRAGFTPWEALGVSAPVFLFAISLVVVMFLAIAAVIALTLM